MALTDAQIRRYARQLVMKEITGAGQERLLGIIGFNDIMKRRDFRQKD